jgi:signal transduction histidine kinase
VPDVRQDPRFFSEIDTQTGFRTRSLAAVPLWVRGKIIGVLEVVNKRQEGCLADFDAEDLSLVETLAVSAAVAIDNARLVKALRQYAAELEARNDELDAYAHTVAHDLQNPLALIVGFVDVLQADASLKSHQELQKRLRIIRRNGRKMNNIIDELLLLSSVRQRDQVPLVHLDMARIVGEAQERLTDLVREQQAQIFYPNHWPPALGYSPWVEEVWVNYMSNAVKYGGRPPCLKLGAEAVEDDDDMDMVRFWVRDNGEGLTQEEQAQLFTPFEQLDQVRARGHGLGLSIVHRIVKKLGGQVGVHSQPGQGSEFWFTLPRGANQP